MNLSTVIDPVKAATYATGRVTAATPSWITRRLDPHVDAEIMVEIGERKIMEIGKHWMASIRAIIKLLVATGILLLWIAWTPEPHPELWGPLAYYEWPPWMFLLWLAIFLTVRAVWKITQHFKDRFVITNQRILRREGVIANDSAFIPLAKVTDITVKQSALGRLFDYGHMIFESAGQVQGLDEIRYVQDPQKKKRVLLIALKGDNPDALVLNPAENNPDDGT